MWWPAPIMGISGNLGGTAIVDGHCHIPVKTIIQAPANAIWDNGESRPRGPDKFKLIHSASAPCLL